MEPTLTGLRGRVARLSLMLDTGLLALIFTALPPALPSIAKQFGGGEEGAFVAQLVMTMPSIGLIIGGLISGWIVNRFGARATFLGGLVAFAVLGSGGLYLDTAPLLLASRLLMGIASVTLSTGAGYLIGVFISDAERPKFLGYRNALASVIGFIATFAAGPLAEYVGWRAPFVLYLVALAIMALGSLLPTVAKPAPEKASAESLGHLVPIYAMVIPIFIVVMMNGAQLSFLLAGDGVESAVTQSQVIGIAGVFSAVGSAAFGFVRLRLGIDGTFVLCCLLLGGGTALIGASHDVMIQGVGSILTGTGCGFISPHFKTLIYERASRGVLSRAIGWLYASQFFGDFLNPFVLGAITAVVGLHGTFMVAGVAVMLTATAPLFRRMRVLPTQA